MKATIRNILIISSEFPPDPGGIGNHAYNLARALGEYGFKVTVIADIVESPERAIEDLKKTSSFQLLAVKRQKPVLKTYLSRIIYSRRETKKADLIICSGKFSLWLINLLKPFNRSKKFVAIAHGTELDLKSPVSKHFTDISIGKFNAVISVSRYTEKYLPFYLPGRVRRYVIHNGINLSEFDSVQQQQLDGEPSLVTVGSVTQRKGQGNVIAALPEIKQRFPAVAYHVIGKPTIKEVLKNQSDKLGLNGSVKFYGAVGRTELLSKLSGAKVKLMLSNHTEDGDFEGFGIAVLEANALGIPAIGTRNSGIADAIEDKKTGVLVDPKNAVEVSGAVSEVVNHYERYSANAKKWAAKHDWKNIVQQYIKVFAQV